MHRMDEVTIEEVIEIGNQIMGIKFVIINTPVTIQRVLEFKTKFGIGAYNEGI